MASLEGRRRARIPRGSRFGLAQDDALKGGKERPADGLACRRCPLLKAVIMRRTRGTARSLARLRQETPRAGRACRAECKRSAYRVSLRVLRSRHATAAEF